MFNATKVFDPVRAQPTLILTVKANGGSVLLEIQHSPGVFVTAELFTADTAKAIYLGGATFRLTPTGGAEYNLV